jgi:plasmid stabilization system protein ParE
MPNTLVILPEAREEIDLAFKWYEEHILGLGYEFMRSVDNTLRMIDREPNLYPIVHECYHRALIRRFPFAIFYEYENEQVVIYSVFHSSQNPIKWQGRLK